MLIAARSSKLRACDVLALRERIGANRSRYSMRPFPSFPITSVPAFALNSFR